MIFNGSALQWNRLRIEESDVTHNDALYQAAKDYRPEAYRAPVGGIIDSGFCGDRDGGRNLIWTLDDAQRALVDADRDKKITASDARLILRAAVGLEDATKW